MAAVVAPSSRGSLRLASPAPDAAPLIDPGFLADARDTDRLETGLRVADASTMPVITNAHPNATVLAIAERAADLLLSAG